MIDSTDLIGTTLYFVEDWVKGSSTGRWDKDRVYGGVGSGTVLRVTNDFCVLTANSGIVNGERRKSKRLLFETVDEAQACFVQQADAHIRLHFNMNIIEMSNIFIELRGKYPEKFI